MAVAGAGSAACPIATCPTNCGRPRSPRPMRRRRRYYRLAEPSLARSRGAKIATTTKVMQQLMGITHPCGGADLQPHYSSHPRPSCALADFVNLRIESEIALKLGADLPALRRALDARGGRAGDRRGDAGLRTDRGPQRRLCDHRGLVADRRELLERRRRARNAETRPTSMISSALPAVSPLGGKLVGEGAAEDPCATLAWLANHVAAARPRSQSGMIVITGSLIADGFDRSPASGRCSRSMGWAKSSMDVV